MKQAVSSSKVGAAVLAVASFVPSAAEAQEYNDGYRVPQPQHTRYQEQRDLQPRYVNSHTNTRSTWSEHLQAPHRDSFPYRPPENYANAATQSLSQTTQASFALDPYNTAAESSEAAPQASVSPGEITSAVATIAKGCDQLLAGMNRWAVFGLGALSVLGVQTFIAKASRAMHRSFTSYPQGREHRRSLER